MFWGTGQWIFWSFCSLEVQPFYSSNCMFLLSPPGSPGAKLTWHNLILFLERSFFVSLIAYRFSKPNQSLGWANQNGGWGHPTHQGNTVCWLNVFCCWIYMTCCLLILFQSLSLIVKTLMKLLKNLRPFAGIIVVSYSRFWVLCNHIV